MGTVAKMSFSSATAGKAMAAGFCNQERATKIQDSLGYKMYKIYKQEDMGSDTFAYRWIFRCPNFCLVSEANSIDALMIMADATVNCRSREQNGFVCHFLTPAINAF